MIAFCQIPIDAIGDAGRKKQYQCQGKLLPQHQHNKRQHKHYTDNAYDVGNIAGFHGINR
jgi:hypothetical protein